ncbi:MAG: hypothetical protein ACM3MK_09570 [Chitinophagales bacterium]
MKKVIAGIAGLLLLFLLFSGVSYAISPIEQARICAEENLPESLNIVTPDFKDYGFKSMDLAKGAKLGDPLDNYVIPIKDFDGSRTIEEQMQPTAFYAFPVQDEDNNSVCDLTVYLRNGEWTWVDVGGSLNRDIEEVSKDNGIELKDNIILRSSVGTVVIVTKDDKNYWYSPHLNYSTVGVKAQELVSMDLLSKLLIERQKEYQEAVKDNEGLSPYSPAKKTTGVFGPMSPIPFNQKGVLSRLNNYLSFYILNKK